MPQATGPLHTGADPSLFQRVLWLGGAQWAGKTSVAQLLAVRHPLVLYSYDYHDARAHYERALAEPERFPRRAAWLAALEQDPDTVWVRPDPVQMAAATLAIMHERFQMVLEDLAALPAGATILAEGYGLRPDFLAPLLREPESAVFLVPSERFRAQQIRSLPRAGSVGAPVSDPARAQANRLERDRLLALDVVASAASHGLRVIEVDGGRGVPAIAAEVEAQFRPFLPRWLY